MTGKRHKKVHTTMYELGYRFYVYVGPGNIEYFKTLDAAISYHDEMGGTIGEVH